MSNCLTPAQVGKLLGVSPQAIRVMAREHPEQLGFPVLCVKSRVRIPTVPFLRWLKGGNASAEEEV